MEYRQKQSRTQLALYTTCLDDMIADENSVRAIDRFVDGLDLQALGFGPMASQGRPPNDPADLLKLYIYAYLNRIRSSRSLELECTRNIELIWGLGNLRPDHNTIARFRKDSPKAIKRVFRATVSIAKNHELIGSTLIAGDSTKLRAQNSKKGTSTASADFGSIALAYNLKRLIKLGWKPEIRAKHRTNILKTLLIKVKRVKNAFLQHMSTFMKIQPSYPQTYLKPQIV